MNKKIIGGVIGFIVIVIALVSMSVLQSSAMEKEEQTVC